MADETTKSPLLLQLEGQLAAAEARRDAAALSDDDAKESDLRAKIAAAEAAALKAERARRDLELSRRIEAAKVAAPGADVRGIVFDRTGDSFVLRWDDDAYAAWAKAPERNDEEREKARIDVVSGFVVDWNGTTDFSGATSNGFKLRQFLAKHIDIVIRLTVVVRVEMGSANAEARKS